MAISFRGVTRDPLADLTVTAPDACIIGIAGLRGSGKARLLRLAAGVEQPEKGTIEARGTRRLIALGQPLDFSPVDLLLLDAALACQDPLVRAQAEVHLGRLRCAGTTILMASHDEPLLARLCDEIWWLQEGRLTAKGDPAAILPQYRTFIADRLAEWGRSQPQPLDVKTRRGDGRAEILELETIGPDGQQAAILRSHQPAAIRVRLRFSRAVDNPVIGILIRTRVGLEVYGTNTELERIQLGPTSPGQEVQVEFAFPCALCPGEYTITAASHDPDGAPHDWIDDAILFSVADNRYTAGVANLRAKVTVRRF